MDCVEAQSFISEAMDRQPIAPALLAEAKAHCRTCPQCTAFVRAQLAAKRAPLPEPPSDLADRVMGVIRAEAEAKAAAIAAEEERAREAELAAASAPTLPVAPPVSLAPRPVRKRRLPRMWVSAAAAAAVIVALVGTGAVVVFGMKTMSGSAPTEAPVNRDGTYGQEGAQAPSSYGKAPMAAQDGATAAKAAVPEFITVNGFVYSLSGSEDTSASSLTRLGTTTSSLALNGQAVQRTVYAGPSSDTVYVVDSDERVLAFARVTREYQGQTYVLFSSEITAFGQWPSLPSGIAVPTSPDGSPTFVTGGDDASGVQTYRPAIAQGADGIAIAPSTDTGLMQGNPNWTWWTVAR